MGVVLVTGGTRSGKSAFAERLLAGLDDVAYLATASTTDGEMADRIAAHRARRPATWRTIEVGDDPAGALAAADGRPVLFDGVGGWIAGALHRAGVFDGGDLDAATVVLRTRLSALLAVASLRTAPTVVVVEQAGMAPVAADRATRRWVDLVGEAARGLADLAGEAWLVVAGRAVPLPRGRGADGAAATGHARPLHGDRMVPPGHARPPHGDRMVPAGHADFAVNVTPDPPPAWLRAALRDALDHDARAYPDEHAAVAAVAARHGRTPDGVLPLNGAAEGFWLLAAALSPRRPIVVTPAFTEAATALRAHGHPPGTVTRRGDFTLRPQDVPDDADLVVLANPCNPTGTLHPRAAIEALARPGRTLVVDEAFMDFVPGEPESLANAGAVEGLVVLRSLTKALAIPGLRAGFLLAAPSLVARLAALRQPWPVNTLALAALRAWAEQPDPTSHVAHVTGERRERLRTRLAALDGVHVHPGAANFLLVRVPGGPRVLAALRDARIAVRPTTDLGLDADHLRIAVRDDRANDRLVAALATALSSPTPEKTP